MEECQALMALYESTNGDFWDDNTGWLANQRPCSWYGVICEQGYVVELQLYYNQLAGTLPSEIGNLTHLKSLYLDRSQLSGPIPVEIGNLKELEVARFGGNQFNSLPAELGNLSNLMFLEVWGNQLSGEIPVELGSLSKLQVLNLSSNELTGSIPPELGNLQNLTNLHLSDNQLSGPIPPELGNLYILNELNLSSNQLSGSIPAEFGNLTNLYLLDLSYNQLTGEVPAALASAPISDLKLWGNQLYGTIPASAEEITPVDYGGVHFEISSDLAESIWPEVVTAQPPVDGGFGFSVRPEHVRFTFANPPEPDQFQVIGGIGVSGDPQILIYPAREFGEMSEIAKPEIEALQSLLETRPSVPEDKLPFLPLVNASPVFHAQEEYLDFQNGSGVRFITAYSQEAIGRLANKYIFYTFQGLTQDGEHYVAATFPIAAEGLKDELVDEDWQAAQVHLAEDILHLDSLSADQFQPSLDVLDQVIQSLAVKTP